MHSQTSDELNINLAFTFSKGRVNRIIYKILIYSTTSKLCEAKESYEVFTGSSVHGPWTSIGSGSGTQEFDFSSSSVSEMQFVKIEDKGNSFKLDAIAALEDFFTNTPPAIVKDNLVQAYNYPNPFKNSTTINFSIPNDKRIAINVYDINGKIIHQLTNQIFAKGSHDVTFEKQHLNAGVFYFEIQTANFRKNFKMIHLK